jgi:class 3 adenylate cyclase/tetratricopeptide (TPR) repeat protein
MTCPVCGTVTVPGARFCHSCGHALPAAASLPAAERRVVTVIFGDLSDFTAWSEGVDPERVGAVTDRVLAALAGAVKTFGGHVDKLTGDGIMAVFGAPVAHEDDPERAVRAALAMQRAVRRVLDDERGGGAPAGLRIGINTGDVVAGVQASLEYTVIGDTVNTAARLADAAAVGAVYAGAPTSTATRHLASWRRLLPLRLKGKRHAVEAYELLGLLDAPGTRSGLGDEGPFVGREAEMALVASRLVEVSDRDEPRVLVFTADAGVGKTRLAAEVARVAFGSSTVASGSGRSGGSGGARVLSVRCAAYGERWRLGPLADLVRAAVGLPDPGTTPVTRAVAEERLRRVAQVIARRTGSTPNLPTEQLLALLGYPEQGGADRTADDSAVADRTNDLADGPVPSAPQDSARDARRRDGAPEAAAELLSALATDAPVVVIVDDLHDASSATVDALGAMLGHLTGPVLVVLLGRPELVRTAGALTRIADAEVHPITPLRGAEMSRLLQAYLSASPGSPARGSGRLSTSDSDRLLATAQGNPFYLAELVTLLIERGALTSGPSAWQLAPGSLSGRLLSRDLAAVLAARIDALPADSRTVLRDAAVVGDAVPTAALTAVRATGVVADPRPAAVVSVEAERALGELLHRRMLLPSRHGYAFATPLLREAAYAGVGKADLADRHARLARWAAALRPAEDGTPVPSLGWTAEAIDAFIAEQAERAARLADAVSLRPDAPSRAVAALGVAALGRLSRRAILAGEPAQAAEFGERARALAEDELPVGDRLVYASALVQLRRTDDALAETEAITSSARADGAGPRVDAAAHARALLLAGRAHLARGDGERGDAAWAQALAVATEAGLPTERAEALRRIGMAEYRRGRVLPAQAGFQEALAIAEQCGDRRGEAWALQNLAWVQTTLGDFTQAEATLTRASRLFTELGNTTGRAWLRGTTAFTRLLAGRLHEARRLALAFLPFGERVGEPWAVGTLRAVAAFAGAELGDLVEADALARQAFTEFDAVCDDWGRSFALVVRGVIARERDEPAGALLDAACRHGEQTGHPLLLGIAHTVRGFDALAAGDTNAAERDARTVLAAMRPYGVADAARIAPRVLLGRVRLARGDVTGAVEILGTVAATVQAGGPSLLLSPRRTVAEYAEALLAAERVPEALATARRAVQLPGEDVRGRVFADRVLARAEVAAGALAAAPVTSIGSAPVA